MRSPEAPPDTREMYMLHTMFRREFAALPGLVRAVRVGDSARARVVADHVRFLIGVLQGHHRAEDAIMWPLLLERGREEVAPIVHTLEDHHVRIEDFCERVGTAVEEWRQPASAQWRDRLAGLVDRLTALLYEHMSLEEVRALPLAEKHMTHGEWARMAQHSGAGMPPGSLPLVFGMTLYEADPEVIGQTLAQTPPEVRETLQKEGARAYAAYAERVHGTPTPPRSGPLKA